MTPTPTPTPTPRFSAYVDSGIITKWYIPEPDSASALALRRRLRPPLPFVHLHRLELTTAWHLKAFRREISVDVAERAIGHLETDIDAGVWIRADYDLPSIFAVAERLSRRHAAAAGTRTLDVLHVAIAVELGARSLVTCDARQATLARLAGLAVVIP